MLSAQPPALLAALGLPLEMIQSEMKKQKEMDKLKVMQKTFPNPIGPSMWSDLC